VKGLARPRPLRISRPSGHSDRRSSPPAIFQLTCRRSAQDNPARSRLGSPGAFSSAAQRRGNGGVSRAAKGADCKSAGFAFVGSSPTSPTTLFIDLVLWPFSASRPHFPRTWRLWADALRPSLEGAPFGVAAARPNNSDRNRSSRQKGRNLRGPQPFHSSCPLDRRDLPFVAGRCSGPKRTFLACATRLL
jgi:hypothetical protein